MVNASKISFVFERRMVVAIGHELRQCIRWSHR